MAIHWNSPNRRLSRTGVAKGGMTAVTFGFRLMGINCLYTAHMTREIHASIGSICPYIDGNNAMRQLDIYIYILPINTYSPNKRSCYGTKRSRLCKSCWKHKIWHTFILILSMIQQRGPNWLPTHFLRNWSLHWRHNYHDGVSNQQPHGCLLSCLFSRRSKKTSKLRVTGLCVGNSPGPVNSPHKGPVTRKMFPFDDVIMIDPIAAICFKRPYI